MKFSQSTLCTFVCGAGLALSTAAHAFSNFQVGNGKNEVAAICQSLPFETDKDQCFANLRTANYFDIDAVSICKTFSFTDDKIRCISTIKDKYYEPYETRFCANKNFTDERMTCLATNGKPFTGGGSVDAARVRAYVNSALSDLRSGNTFSAQRTLEDLLRELDGGGRPSLLMRGQGLEFNRR